jgi:hypothetical protein
LLKGIAGLRLRTRPKSHVFSRIVGLTLSCQGRRNRDSADTTELCRKPLAATAFSIHVATSRTDEKSSSLGSASTSPGPICAGTRRPATEREGEFRR